MKILLASGVAALLSAAMFQMPVKPPMKMGLWESTSVMTMKMADAPAGMPFMGRPRSTTVRSCITPESYSKNFYNGQQQKDCTRTNESWTGSQYSFDISCPTRNTTGHFQMNLTGMDTGHGTMHMDMNPGGHAATMDMTYETHFVSAECGAVTPDKPEVVH